MSLLLVDSDPEGLETLTYGFEREGSNVNATSDLQAAPKLVGAAAPSLVVVTLRSPEPSAFEVIRMMRTGGHAIPHVAVMALGPSEHQAQARTAGADDFLSTPTFIRDVVNAGKLALVNRRASGQNGPQTQARLSDYQGLYYLLRAMSATACSASLRLERGNRRAELRISEGRLVSVNVEALQGLPALHHVLLWEEAALSLKLGPVPKRSALNLSAQEVLDESERFLRDFAHAARGLGPSNTRYLPAKDSEVATPGLQPNQIAPLLRLFDGRRILADVIAESPFRIFDTLRMLKRLRDSGALVEEDPPPRRAESTDPVGGAPSMLGEWAMIPDLRGVVGNRRGPSRPLRPVGVAASSAPAPVPLLKKKIATASGEVGPGPRPTPAGVDLSVAPTIQVKLDAHGVPLSAPIARAPLAPTPLTVTRPTGQRTPIALRTRADTGARVQLRRTPLPPISSGRSGTGPQPRLGRTPLPQSSLSRAPTGKQTRLGRTPPPQASLGRSPTGPQPRFGRTPLPQQSLGRSPTGPQPRLDPTPPSQAGASASPSDPRPRPDFTEPPRANKAPSGSKQTLSAAFDEVESDFFAREADLYKRESLDTFDDLDRPVGRGPVKPTSRKR